MATNRICRLCLYLWTLLVCVSGCAYPISKEIRKQVTKDLTFPEVFQKPTAYVGAIVIWGGKIIETINQKDGTDIIVLEMPLNFQQEPENEHKSEGRFIAKTKIFLDPAIYKKGRKVTLAGEIIGKETRSLGNMEYTYPVVMVKQIHLWKTYRYRYEYDPWYYGYYDYWYSPWYRPYFYPYYYDYWYSPWYGPNIYPYPYGRPHYRHRPTHP